jgi:lipopolysaccharide export system permease protein
MARPPGQGAHGIRAQWAPGERVVGILSRYVLRQTAGALVLILVSLTGVVWIAVALRQLELMTSQGQDVLRFLAITALAIPSMLAVIAPIALLIASIHVLNRLNGDSELIVMTAGGMPVWSLLKPLGLLALMVACGIATVNHLVGPWSQRLLGDLVIQVRTDLMAQVLQPWRFTSPEPKLTVHIRDRTPAGELLGLMLHDTRDAAQEVTYLAERGQIIKQGPAAYLRMEKGHIIRRLPDQPAPQIISFDRYAVDMNRLEQRPDHVLELRPRERYTLELIAPNPNDPVYRLGPGKFTAELHERLSNPLYAFAFTLLVLAFMGQAQTTRHNRMQGVIGAFSVATGCRILGIAAANTTSVRPSASYILYLVPLLAGGLAAVAAGVHMYPKRPSILARAVAAQTARAGAALAGLWPQRGPMAGQRRTRS